MTIIRSFHKTTLPFFVNFKSIHILFLLQHTMNTKFLLCLLIMGTIAVQGAGKGNQKKNPIHVLTKRGGYFFQFCFLFLFFFVTTISTILSANITWCVFLFTLSLRQYERCDWLILQAVFYSTASKIQVISERYNEYLTNLVYCVRTLFFF